MCESSKESGWNERDSRLYPLESAPKTKGAKNYVVFTEVNQLWYGP